jgi:hypothetical protein
MRHEPARHGQSWRTPGIAPRFCGANVHEVQPRILTANGDFNARLRRYVAV